MWLYLQKAPSCSWGHTPLGWLYGDRLLSGWRWFDVASIDMSLSKLWGLVMDSSMLQFMGLQRIGHNRATALNLTDVAFSPSQGSLPYLCLPSRFFFFFFFLSPHRLSFPDLNYLPHTCQAGDGCFQTKAAGAMAGEVEFRQNHLL